MALIFFVAFALPFGLSLVLTRLMIALAPRLGIVDRPADRKVHAQTTPLGGGVAIFASVVATLALAAVTAWAARRGWLSFLPEAVHLHADGVLATLPLLAVIMGTATIQMVLGLIDDWRAGGLSYQLRLGVEAVLVVLLVSQGVCLTLFTTNAWVTIPVTAAWVVGLTNALNFLDNMDALSGGVALIASLFFALITGLVGSVFIAGCFVVLSGALVGFLRYNWHPAKIFMGDAGSNFLGFWLGVLTVVGTFHVKGFSHITVFAPLCVLAVPIYDSTTVIVLRLAQGQSPFKPDKQHLSHRLVQLGFRPRNAVLMIYLISVTCGLSGLLLYFLEPAASPLVLLHVLCMLGIIALMEYVAYRRTLNGVESS